MTRPPRPTAANQQLDPRELRPVRIDQLAVVMGGNTATVNIPVRIKHGG